MRATIDMLSIMLLLAAGVVSNSDILLANMTSSEEAPLRKKSALR